MTLILWISLFAQPPRRDEGEPGGNARARSMHLCMTRESSNNIFLLLSSRRRRGVYVARSRVSPREESRASLAARAKRSAAAVDFAREVDKRTDGFTDGTVDRGVLVKLRYRNTPGARAPANVADPPRRICITNVKRSEIELK